MEQYTPFAAVALLAFSAGLALAGYLAYLKRTAYPRALKAATEAIQLAAKLKTSGMTAEELEAQRKAEEAAKAALAAQVAKL